MSETQRRRLVQRLATGKVLEPGHLSVNFFLGLPVANADYRVVYVDSSYSHAIVVSCSRLGGSLIWILSRTPMIAESLYVELVDRAKKMGFDTSDLRQSPQDGCWSFKEPTGIEAVQRRVLKQSGPRKIFGYLLSTSD